MICPPRIPGIKNANTAIKIPNNITYIGNIINSNVPPNDKNPVTISMIPTISLT